MRIGIVIGRIGGVDGVALETEKWLHVLSQMGHKTFILSGQLQSHIPNVTIFPPLDFHHPLTLREQDDAFFIKPEIEESKLLERIENESQIIKENILEWMSKNKIEILVSQNASALPCHIAMGLGIYYAMKESQVKSIAHDHDFHWERGDRYTPFYSGVKELIEKTFPPKLPNLKHVVINLEAQKQLKEKCGIDAGLLPNVMDFSQDYAVSDHFNNNMRKALNFDSSDILLFQITRIVRRKGIETAIDLISELDDSKYKLIITGSAVDDENKSYFHELEAQVKKLKLQKQVLFAGNNFHSERVSNKENIFSLSDAYSQADACTYFSTYEGFGNAFVEAVLAKKPIFVNNYKPVYWSDIGSKGFKTVMLEDGELTKDAVSEIKTILNDRVLQMEIAEHNYKLGEKYFSFDVLKNCINKLILG